MKKNILMSVAILLTIGSITACTNKDMGTVGGAAIGGVVGNAITGGSGLGTAAGAVGGGLIGRAITN